jgi:hypothetical protein
MDEQCTRLANNELQKTYNIDILKVYHFYLKYFSMHCVRNDIKGTQFISVPYHLHC